MWTLGITGALWPFTQWVLNLKSYYTPLDFSIDQLLYNKPVFLTSFYTLSLVLLVTCFIYNLNPGFKKIVFIVFYPVLVYCCRHIAPLAAVLLGDFGPTIIIVSVAIYKYVLLKYLRKYLYNYPELLSLYFFWFIITVLGICAYCTPYVAVTYVTLFLMRRVALLFVFLGTVRAYLLSAASQTHLNLPEFNKRLYREIAYAYLYFAVDFALGSLITLARILEYLYVIPPLLSVIYWWETYVIIKSSILITQARIFWGAKDGKHLIKCAEVIRYIPILLGLIPCWELTWPVRELLFVLDHQWNGFCVHALTLTYPYTSETIPYTSETILTTYIVSLRLLMFFAIFSLVICFAYYLCPKDKEDDDTNHKR